MNPVAVPHRRLRLLIVEPDSLVRRTVAITARQLDLAEIDESATHERGLSMLATSRYDGALIAWDAERHGAALIQRVRDGKSRCPDDMPVVVMADGCDAERLTAFKTMSVRRIVLKPFKVKTLLDAVAALTHESRLPPATGGVATTAAGGTGH